MRSIHWKIMHTTTISLRSKCEALLMTAGAYTNDGAEVDRDGTREH